MALAMLLITLLAFTVWRGTDSPHQLPLRSGSTNVVRLWVIILLVLVVAEGIMGTQIREMTDEMAKSHDGEPREQWISELEQSGLYLAHRSFSWAILVVSLLAYSVTRRATGGAPGAAAKVVLAMVFVQMILGVIMSQIHIYAAVQVLHVGLAAVLLAGVVFWLCHSTRVAPRMEDTVGH
jgi:cytochrome c oxidase assembly protein subunit 15